MLVDSPFLAPLSVTLFGQGGNPFKVDVTVTVSDEVQALRSQLADVQAKLEDMTARFHRVEYLYRCETLINARLVDVCSQHGYKVPKSLFQRPDASF